MSLRNKFIGLAATALVATLVAAPVVQAKEVKFSQSKYEQYKASGTGFMLDFYASWCSTCRVQAQRIAEIKKSNPALAKLPVMKVDWDVYRGKAISKNLKIPRRSTLVVFKGGKEKGRVVAQTSRGAIERLMKKGI